MKFVRLFAFLAGLVPACAHADVVIPLDQTITVVGPFSPDNPANIILTGSVDFGITVPPGGQLSEFATFDVSGSANGTFEACSVPIGPCAYPSFAIVGISSSKMTFLVTLDGAGAVIFEPPNTFIQATNYPQIEVFADLPDGASIAAVPEPSTWTMMLIGFASLGLARITSTPSARALPQ